MATTRVSLAPGAGHVRRLIAAVGFVVLARRLLARLNGVDVVVLAGRAYPVRAVPLGVARNMVPALLRCSQRFASWDIDESLYDDLVTVLSLALRTSPARIEALEIPLWEFAPVIETIARANGLIDSEEAGRSALGKQMRMAPSTGTGSTPSSSAAPGGPGTTSSTS